MEIYIYLVLLRYVSCTNVNFVKLGTVVVVQCWVFSFCVMQMSFHTVLAV